MALKRTALFFTLLIVISSLSYLFYDKYLRIVDVAINDYVTDDAALVIESNSFLKSIEKYDKGVIQLFNSSRYEKILSVLDTSESKWNNLLDGPIIISFHISGNNTFDNTFYIDLSKNGRDKFFLELISQFEGSLKLSTRNYLNREIHELGTGENKITYYLDNNILVFSLKSYLIEDIVRTIEEDWESGFFKKNSNLLALPRLSNDDGNLYVNNSKFNDFVNVLSKSKSDLSKNLALSGFLDLTFSNNSVFLNGFTLSSKGKFLSTFHNQLPVPDNFDYFIPLGADIVSKFLTSDAPKWHIELIEFWKANYEKYLLKRNDFIKSYGLDIEKIYSWIKDGVCLVNLDNDPLSNKLLFISTNDVN